MYKWRPANGDDIPKLVKLSNTHFREEVDVLFDIDLTYLAKHLAYAVINQFYTAPTELLYVCERDDGAIIAYVWAKAGDRAYWSTEPMVNINMVHVDMSLPPRQRIQLVKDMINIWEGFAVYARCPVICSSTMRKERDTFLKLHAKLGYDVRGNVAYKRLDLNSTTTQATPANSLNPE